MDMNGTTPLNYKDVWKLTIIFIGETIKNHICDHHVSMGKTSFLILIIYIYIYTVFLWAIYTIAMLNNQRVYMAVS